MTSAGAELGAWESDPEDGAVTDVAAVVLAHPTSIDATRRSERIS